MAPLEGGLRTWSGLRDEREGTVDQRVPEYSIDFGLGADPKWLSKRSLSSKDCRDSNERLWNIVDYSSSRPLVGSHFPISRLFSM